MEWLSALPFEWARFEFMRYALAGILLLCPMFAVLGTMVVDSRMAFFSDSLGHSALTGIGIGAVLGFRNQLGAMLVFGVLFAVLLIFVKGRGAASTDTTIGIFSSSALALGIVLLSSGGGFSKYSSYLVGDILAIRREDLLWLALTLMGVALYWTLCYNRLMLVALNRPLAQSRGIDGRLVEMGFAAVVAVVVMLSIQWVGVLMINAMLVLPPAIARNLAGSAPSYHLYAVAAGLLCGVGGLLLSFYLGTASGATIVLTMAALYTVTLFGRREPAVR